MPASVLLSDPFTLRANSIRPHKAYDGAEMAEKSCSTSELSERWAVYLSANFHSAEQIARAFSVSERTAWNWMSQNVSPRAHHVATAMARDYEAIPQLIGRDPWK